MPSGDLAEVFERVLDTLVEKLEERKFRAGRRPRENRQPPARAAKRKLVPDGRHVPDRVRNAVRERDGGRRRSDLRQVHALRDPFPEVRAARRLWL